MIRKINIHQLLTNLHMILMVYLHPDQPINISIVILINISIVVLICILTVNILIVIITVRYCQISIKNIELYLLTHIIN